LVQDLGLPSDKAVEFMDFVDCELGIYPLWLCPLKTEGDQSEFQLKNMKTPMCINVGVWGNAMPNYDEFLRQNRILEQKLMELGGRKWFYAHAYYTEKEFWQIYNKNWYNKLRKKYHAEHLPSVFDKVVVKKKFKMNIGDGVRSALLGKAKLKIK